MLAITFNCVLIGSLDLNSLSHQLIIHLKFYLWKIILWIENLGSRRVSSLVKSQKSLTMQQTNKQTKKHLCISYLFDSCSNFFHGHTQEQCPFLPFCPFL